MTIDPIQVLTGFFPEYYLATNPDVANHAHFGASEARAFEHYIHHGVHELREPNPFFRPQFYKDTHPDLQHLDGAGLLLHWGRHGIEEGRGGTKSFDLGWYVDNHADLRKKFGKNNYLAAFNHWIEEGNEERRLTASKRIMRAIAVNNKAGITPISGKGERI
jgi:hypothetical protein